MSQGLLHCLNSCIPFDESVFLKGNTVLGGKCRVVLLLHDCFVPTSALAKGPIDLRKQLALSD